MMEIRGSDQREFVVKSSPLTWRRVKTGPQYEVILSPSADPWDRLSDYRCFAFRLI